MNKNLPVTINSAQPLSEALATNLCKEFLVMPEQNYINVVVLLFCVKVEQSQMFFLVLLNEKKNFFFANASRHDLVPWENYFSCAVYLRQSIAFDMHDFPKV